MTHDPTKWAVLGQAIRDDRVRQGLSREALSARIKAAGLEVSARTIGSIERGKVPAGDVKFPSVEPTVTALGWQIGWADRILAGEDPGIVLRRNGPHEEPADDSPRMRLLELVPNVYEFSGTAATLGAPPELRDEFDRLARRLLDSAQSTRVSQRDLGLAADRPHAEGEGIPVDDAERIRRAMGQS